MGYTTKPGAWRKPNKGNLHAVTAPTHAPDRTDKRTICRESRTWRDLSTSKSSGWERTKSQSSRCVMVNHSHRIQTRLMSISTTKNLGTLQRLRILSIQSNRITKLEGLDGLTNLEEFYISHNGLTKLEGLEHNVRRTSHILVFLIINYLFFSTSAWTVISSNSPPWTWETIK